MDGNWDLSATSTSGKGKALVAKSKYRVATWLRPEGARGKVKIPSGHLASARCLSTRRLCTSTLSPTNTTMGRRSRAKEQRLNNCTRARLAKAEKTTMPVPSPDESPLGHPARQSSPNLECPAVQPVTPAAIGGLASSLRFHAAY